MIELSFWNSRFGVIGLVDMVEVMMMLGDKKRSEFTGTERARSFLDDYLYSREKQRIRRK